MDVRTLEDGAVDGLPTSLEARPPPHLPAGFGRLYEKKVPCTPLTKQGEGLYLGGFPVA